MARYNELHKPRTRRRILGAASRVFRRTGYVGSSIDDVMQQADLTKGGFYSHFRSKRSLFAITLEHTFERQRRIWNQTLGSRSGVARIRGLIDLYLSDEHLVREELACPLPCLLSEVRRSGPAAQEEVARFIAWMIDAIVETLQADPDVDVQEAELRQVATLIATSAIGAVTAGRACPHEYATEQIFGPIRRRCHRLLDSLLADAPTRSHTNASRS